MDINESYSYVAIVNIKDEYKGSLGSDYTEDREYLKILNNKAFKFIALTEKGSKEFVMWSSDMEEDLYRRRFCGEIKVDKLLWNCLSSHDLFIVKGFEPNKVVEELADLLDRSYPHEAFEKMDEILKKDPEKESVMRMICRIVNLDADQYLTRQVDNLPVYSEGKFVHKKVWVDLLDYIEKIKGESKL